MNCPACQNEARKFGKDRYGNQRFQCLTCKKTFSDRPTKPLGTMRLDLDAAAKILHLLLEGMSIRSASRISGTNRSTIIDLVVKIGERCEEMLKGRIHDMPVVDLQCDEVWGFVKMKEKTRAENCPDRPEVGDAYCFVALERNTKMVVGQPSRPSRAVAWRAIRPWRPSRGRSSTPRPGRPAAPTARSEFPKLFNWTCSSINSGQDLVLPGQLLSPTRRPLVPRVRRRRPRPGALERGRPVPEERLRLE